MEKLEKKIDLIARALLSRNASDRSEALSQLQELMSRRAETPTDPDNLIRAILLELGMPDHIKGHAYTVCALTALIEDPTLIDAVTGKLYPLVASIHGVTPVRVERAIRHAIEVCLTRVELDTMSAYFGSTISALRGKPTNSEFLARIANVARQRLRAA